MSFYGDVGKESTESILTVFFLSFGHTSQAKDYLQESKVSS